MSSLKAAAQALWVMLVLVPAAFVWLVLTTGIETVRWWGQAKLRRELRDLQRAILVYEASLATSAAALTGVPEEQLRTELGRMRIRRAQLLEELGEES